MPRYVKKEAGSYGYVFNVVYDRLMAPLERRGLKERRKELLSKATGQVLEIGSGTGLNFPFYKSVAKVTAIEPDSGLRNKSMERAKKASATIEVLAVKAEDLPFPDHSFDSIVCTLVLCSVEDPPKAVQEMKRVCKPNGNILLLEHVKVTHPLASKCQDLLTPMWKRLCEGCHLNRPTLELLEQSGFKALTYRRFWKGTFIIITIKA